MINLTKKNCVVKECTKEAYYNFPNLNTRLYCSTHKKQNMIDITRKRCIFEKCSRIASYNLPNSSGLLYCFEHKLQNMVTKKKKCIFENCDKLPTYNIPSEKKPIYCVNHKMENMINVIQKKCSFEECDKIASYNFPDQINGLFCIDHKSINMVNIRNNMCKKPKCYEKAIYGFINSFKPIYCFNHKENEMIDLILENQCSVLNCEKKYCFIVDDFKYCSQHYQENCEIEIKRLCKYCDIKENSTYICNECKEIANKKEWAVVRYLKKNIKTKFEYNTSKMLQGCSKRRPDVYFELNKHSVIVEIDENQHKSYEDSCECSRINEIVNGIGGKSVIIIRFNPDITRNKGTNLKLTLSDKMDLLVNTIKEELAKDYNSFQVKMIQLYYDDNYDDYQSVKVEDITKLVCV